MARGSRGTARRGQERHKLREQTRDGGDGQRVDISVIRQVVWRQQRLRCEPKMKSYHAREPGTHTTHTYLSRPRRCRGHLGPASGCPTGPTEGNGRLKRVCPGPRIRSDEIEFHGVAPGTRHGARWHAMRRELQGGIAWAEATCRPVSPGRGQLLTTMGRHVRVRVDTQDCRAH